MAEPLSAEQVAEYHRIFSLVDRDGDGKICSKELEVLMKSIGKQPTETELKRMMEVIDTDKKGAISFEEFVEMIPKTAHSAGSNEDFREVFSIFDKNNDGFITHSELKDVFKRLGENLSSEEIDEMMFEADTDRDGKLSYEDFVGVMKSM